MNFPFTQIGDTRIFSNSVPEDDLQWHWDEEDRLVIATHETDWQFQYENCLPEPITTKTYFFIKAGQWHRLIKGTGTLTLKFLNDLSH